MRTAIRGRIALNALPQICLLPAGALAGGRPLHGHGGHPEFPVGGPSAGQARAWRRAAVRKAGAGARARPVTASGLRTERWYFETWGAIEIAIGAALLLILLFGSDEKNLTLLLALLMLLIAILQRFALTPWMVVLGRIIDWIPADQPSAERSRFWMLHNAFVGLELLNWALGLFLTGKLLLRGRRQRVDQDTELLERGKRAAR